MQSYDLRETLDILHSGTWFSLAAVQADENRATGGKIIRLKRAKLARRQPAEALLRAPTNQHPTAALVGVPTNQHPNQELLVGVPTNQTTHTKNPHHDYNFTRNILTLGNTILTIHPLLIFQINGRQVI